jgi:hypothetical protein
MEPSSVALWALSQEARALLTRLDRVKPYAVNMPMVTAAALPAVAQTAIESHMTRVRRKLRAMVHQFLRWLRGPDGHRASPAEAQRRFTLLRLRFTALLTQFDIFADVITQRSQHDIGVWIAGLDDVAADALRLPGDFYREPPVICYLDRGYGAAIRRARTRLPGGDQTPVAIIRVPRERMIGSGIGSSLVHEVGHQGAALLDLVNSLRPVLRGLQRGGGMEQTVWAIWERWISEIVADLWSVAKLGISSTVGLLAVVSLPRPFVFRIDAEDPHPSPWIRVKLSCAMGRELYPHPQWDRLAELWESFYPLVGLNEEKRILFAAIEASIPRFVAILVNHRPEKLRGRSLLEVVAAEDRQPARLAAYYQEWGVSPERMRRVPPSLAFAVIGQARVDGRITPEQESNIIANLLTYWAVQSSLTSSATCAALPMPQRQDEPAALQTEVSLSTYGG